MQTCPNCTSRQTVKNGRIHNGKQRLWCRECGRQFVEQSLKKVIDLLLLERTSLAGLHVRMQVAKT